MSAAGFGKWLGPRRAPKAGIEAVVVGGGLNALGVARSLGSARVPVLLLAGSPDMPAARSRYVRCHVYDAHDADNVIDALVKLATALPGARRPLILTEEEVVTAVSAQRERLQPHYILMLPPADVVTRLLHKDGFHKAAEADAQPIPQTRRVCSVEDIDALHSLVPPLVIKPAGRQRMFLAHFPRATQVASVDKARALLADMLKVSDDLVVQEWIDGDDSTIHFCLQYGPDDGGPPVSFVGRKLRSWPRQTGGTARCVAAAEAVALEAMTTRFFREQGVTGLAGMEYKWRSATREFVMIEPTIGRTDYQAEVATLNGVNLPLAAYRHALGHAAPGVSHIDPPRIWKDAIADANAAAVDAGIANPAPPGARVVDALRRIDDPMPALLDFRDRARMKISRTLGLGR